MIESHGAELNHDVFEDGMFISLKSLDIHFEKLSHILNLIINKPLLSESQFQIVRTNILNMIRKDKENPFNISFEKWKKIVYLDHPYAFSCIGNIKDVSEINHADLLSEYENYKFREKYLISNNKNFYQNPEKESIKKTFKENRLFQKLKFIQKSRIACSYKKSNQLILMLGNQTCSRKCSEFLPLKVLESYLSFGMSSILFRLFRENNGITYDVGVFNPVRKENAPFLIYLSVSNKNALLAFDLLLNLWKDLLFKLVSNEEISLQKIN